MSLRTSDVNERSGWVEKIEEELTKISNQERSKNEMKFYQVSNTDSNDDLDVLNTNTSQESQDSDNNQKHKEEDSRTISQDSPRSSGGGGSSRMPKRSSATQIGEANTIHKVHILLFLFSKNHNLFCYFCSGDIREKGWKDE